MTIALLVLLVGLGWYALGSRDLLHGVIALSALSLLSALLFYILQAPDVAITEAAVGAGVSTVVFVWALRATERRDGGDRLPEDRERDGDGPGTSGGSGTSGGPGAAS